MWPCRPANGGNNVDINVVRLRQGFCMLRHAMWHENSIGKMLVHQRFAARHMMSKWFQNYISQLEKKIRRSLLVSFHSFCNICKKFFFNVDAIKLMAYVEQLLSRSKAAMCCILPRGIVWMHLNRSSGDVPGCCASDVTAGAAPCERVHFLLITLGPDHF